MSDQIQRLACALSESSYEISEKESVYRAALAIHEGIKDKLTTALYERKNADPTAIALDDDEILLCIWDGEDSYEFSLIRLYN
jgi:Trm5-related predicted tRNA methylase